MSSQQLVLREVQEEVEEVDQNQVDVHHVALGQEDTLLVVQHPLDVPQDPRPQDHLVEQEEDLQVEAPMAPSRRQEVQEDPKDLRHLPLELSDRLVDLDPDQNLQLVHHVDGPQEDVQVSLFLHPPEQPAEQPATAAAPQSSGLPQLVRSMACWSGDKPSIIPWAPPL